MSVGASALSFAKAMPLTSRSSITTEVEHHGSDRTSRPPAETRTRGAQAQRQPAVARYRRAVRPHHRHSQRPPLDHGGHGGTAGAVFWEQRAVLAPSAGGGQHRGGGEGGGRG